MGTRLSGRSCIVTGAARGIGRAIGEALLCEGAMSVSPISMPTRSPRSRHRTASAEASGGKVTHASVDVTDRMQVRALIAHAVSVFGKIDVKFNNAGVNRPMNFLDVTEENWNFIMGVNGLGCLIGMQETARQMIAQGTGGKIINTASIASRQGFDNVAPYCASNGRLYR
jgi:meso-butanediol dehydrogenase/(S,S)-butanediol dehydrogenase/diacetyl reductase